MTVYNKLFSKPLAKTPKTSSKSKPSIQQQGGLWGGGPDDTITLDQFRQVSTLWKGLTVRAENFAAIEWHLYRLNGRTRSLTPVENHPALELFDQPNELMDGYDFRVTYCLTMDLLGKAFVWTPKHKAAGFPVNQYLIRPDRMTPKLTADKKQVEYYQYRDLDGSKIDYPADEISFRRLPDPLNPLDGVGAVETLLSELAIARISRQWQANFFQNNAAPGGVYSFKDPLEPEDFDEMTERIQQGHSGVSNANRDIILDNAATYQRVSFSMKEMMFPELREGSRDMILEGIGVPKTFLGQATDVNKASADTLEMIFGKYELKPALIRYRSWLNNYVLAQFNSKNNYVFDFENPVKENVEDQLKKIEALERLVKLGVEPSAASEFLGFGVNLVFDQMPELLPAADYNQNQSISNSNMELSR